MCSKQIGKMSIRFRSSVGFGSPLSLRLTLTPLSLTPRLVWVLLLLKSPDRERDRPWPNLARFRSQRTWFSCRRRDMRSCSKIFRVSQVKDKSICCFIHAERVIQAVRMITLPFRFQNFIFQLHSRRILFWNSKNGHHYTSINLCLWFRQWLCYDPINHLPQKGAQFITMWQALAGFATQSAGVGRAPSVGRKV